MFSKLPGDLMERVVAIPGAGYESADYHTNYAEAKNMVGWMDSAAASKTNFGTGIDNWYTNLNKTVTNAGCRAIRFRGADGTETVDETPQTKCQKARTCICTGEHNSNVSKFRNRLLNEN